LNEATTTNEDKLKELNNEVLQKQDSTRQQKEELQKEVL